MLSSRGSAKLALMRLRNLSYVSGLIFALAMSVVWWAPPCCEQVAGNGSALSIGAVPCCGAGMPSRCQPSIQRAEAPVFSLVTPASSPLAVLATEPLSVRRPVHESGLKLKPRLSAARFSFPSLHVPLLI